MIETPDWVRPKINTVYPPYNEIEFERWFYENYEGDITDRQYLPIFFCAYQVNHSYGQDKAAMQRLQDYVDSLPNDIKYHVVSQYDDGVGVDWKGKDVYEFNMSKKGDNMYPLPLIGQPMPFKFNSEKKYLANFIGNVTHPIREHAHSLRTNRDYYISFERHEPYEYCKIISESIFTLCYRGYGLNSFRISEALRYGSIPVYISDEFIQIHNIGMDGYGYEIRENELHELNGILKGELPFASSCTSVLQEYYEQYYTYEGTKDKILKHLLTLK